MSPRTSPWTITRGTSTQPSTTPFGAIDNTAATPGSATTLPTTVPSRCTPPLTNTLPSMRVPAAISVSMRAVDCFFLPNIGLSSSQVVSIFQG